MYNATQPFPGPSGSKAAARALAAALALAGAMPGAAGAATPSGLPQTDPPGTQCQVAANFPDGTSWKTACLVSVIPPRAGPATPRGMVRILEANHKDHLFSLSFFPPDPIKPGTTYPLNTDRTGTFLNVLVQPDPGKELCRMNREFPSQGTVVFTAVGTASAQYHGTLELFPTCSIYQATPQQRMVPGGSVGGGKTTVTF